MKMNYHVKVRSAVLAAALSVGLSVVSPAFAYTFASWIVGSNGEGLTRIGTLGGNDTFATGINDKGQVVGEANLVNDSGFVMLLSPAPTALA